MGLKNLCYLKFYKILMLHSTKRELEKPIMDVMFKIDFHIVQLADSWKAKKPK